MSGIERFRRLQGSTFCLSLVYGFLYLCVGRNGLVLSIICIFYYYISFFSRSSLNRTLHDIYLSVYLFVFLPLGFESRVVFVIRREERQDQVSET